MPGRDVQVDSAGQADFHGAFAAVTVGVGAASVCGSWGASMTHGNFALLQIFDAEGIAECAGQLFELEDFAGVGFFMDAMQGIDAALQEITCDSAVGGEHEFFNEAMGDVAYAAPDADHALLIVELDDLFGEIEVDGAVFVAPGAEQEGQFFHVVEMLYEGGVTCGHLGIFLDDFVYVGVGHAFEGTNDSWCHARTAHVAGGVEFH